MSIVIRCSCRCRKRRITSHHPDTEHDDANEHDHYYSYLYTALFIKEIYAQWERAGFDLRKNPGAVVTLFNIGFGASHPNATPQLAGATIETGGTTYTYGELGQIFYDSDELTDLFPRR
jgi:hypothetical protein